MRFMVAVLIVNDKKVRGIHVHFLPSTPTMSIPEGRREDALAKERDRNREEYERQKQKLIAETERSRPSVQRFVGQHDTVEESLKHSTVGLVSLPMFQQKRKELEEAKAREAARTNELKYVSCLPVETRWLIGCGEPV